MGGAGEIIVGGKKVLFMDEISTGLDSATTFLITKCLSNFCHIMDATLLVALLQPAPETYNLFDDIMLLSQGQIVFHGSREEVYCVHLLSAQLAGWLAVCLSVFLSVLLSSKQETPHVYMRGESQLSHTKVCPIRNKRHSILVCR